MTCVIIHANHLKVSFHLGKPLKWTECGWGIVGVSECVWSEKSPTDSSGSSLRYRRLAVPLCSSGSYLCGKRERSAILELSRLMARSICLEWNVVRFRLRS